IGLSNTPYSIDKHGESFMKIFKTISALCVAVIMAMAISACAPTAKSEGTGGYLDDTVVTTKV
ncbi:TPA: hypothetical protein ACPZT9_004333, partial [Yersinia enterocolitica]